jgi:dihydroorotase-like cyclic amidohydrolase
MADKP